MSETYLCSSKPLETDTFEHCYTVSIEDFSRETLWKSDAINPCGTFVFELLDSENRIDVIVNNQIVANLGPSSNPFSLNKTILTASPLTDITISNIGLATTVKIQLKLQLNYECC
ncbi:hypothetical protein [Pontibacillus sp. HMF3514]|uniref:hypothetical protein n=1 Tax=Pontibacillus sp. HMF3514 TaxID=2692425 RepID=UPI00131F6027|nr:hypothetical protein [Pontibacillus sp. HMF3514]QHE51633.1 hypothetical protein GS400_06095 [Pontibacillus sp. HMF3514]